MLNPTTITRMAALGFMLQLAGIQTVCAQGSAMDVLVLEPGMSREYVFSIGGVFDPAERSGMKSFMVMAGGDPDSLVVTLAPSGRLYAAGERLDFMLLGISYGVEDGAAVIRRSGSFPNVLTVDVPLGEAFGMVTMLVAVTHASGSFEFPAGFTLVLECVPAR